MDSAASEDRQDYSDSDLWSLEKAVEELGEKVNRLEYRPCPGSCNTSGGVEAKMQVEVAWLRKGLENHLRLFKNVFSNSEGLAESESTLDLDQLWALMKRKERKRQRKSKDKKEGIKDHIGESANLRSRRATSVLSKLRDSPLMFLARRIQRSRPSDSLLVSEDTSLNLGQMYSTHTGKFQAPLAGVYLFVLTLNFEPGPSLSGLRRENGELAATLHQDKMASYGPVTRVCLLQLRRGEELRLELLGGTLVTDDPNDNIFAGLLLHHTT